MIESLIEERVKHSNPKLGSGTIKNAKSDKIYVLFDGSNEEKLFKLPGCLAYLSFQNPEIVRLVQTSGTGSSKEMIEPAQNEDAGILTIRQFYDRYINQVNAEAEYLNINGGNRNKIFDGYLVSRTEDYYVYSFNTDSEYSLPPDTQIKLWKTEAEEGKPGVVIDCTDFTILFLLDEYLGAEVPVAEFAAEPWMLLKSLTARMEEAKDQVSPIAKKMALDGRSAIGGYGDVQTGQDRAMWMSFNKPVTFIWGPPGTGKTETLANIAIAHIERGEKVLMLSYSNVSVDGAAKRTYEKYSEARNFVPKGKIIRYGYPKDPEVAQHESLSAYNLAARGSREINEELQSLLRERERLDTNGKRSQKYLELTVRINDRKKKIREKEKEITAKAAFLATTISKAVVDKTIYESQYDVVIVDEASMSYIPQVIFAAGLSKKHFVCLGDYKQLPPIVQSSGASLLKEDIFKYCGIARAVETGRTHEWLCMLDVQYRMHPDIAQFISDNMYKGLLKSADNMELKTRDMQVSIPGRKKPVEVLDLTGTMSVCLPNKRLNVLSALLTMSMAVRASKASRIKQVGIITPYRDQAKLFASLCNDVISNNDMPKGKIEAKTVHQFQGSEQSVILFDAVDCYRQRQASGLLTSAEDDHADRLFNVAMTRAQGQFVAVGNVDYLKKSLPSRLLFRKLIDQETENPVRKTNYRNLLTENSEICKGFDLLDPAKAEDLFIKDLKRARRSILIDIPSNPVIGELLKNTFKVLDARSEELSIAVRAESAEGLPKAWRDRKYVNQDTRAYNPVAIIDGRIIWFGMPHSGAVYVSSSTKVQMIRFRPIIRFEGESTARTLRGYLQMGRLFKGSAANDSQRSQLEQPEKQGGLAMFLASTYICPKCSSPMKMLRSRAGKFYLSCSNRGCNERQMITVDAVNVYLDMQGGKYCPICRRPLKAAISKHGIYVRCTGQEKHFFDLDQF